MKRLLLLFILFVLVGCTSNSSNGAIDIDFQKDVSDIPRVALGEEAKDGKLEFTIHSITKVEENRWLLDIDISDNNSELLFAEYSINLVKDNKPDRITSIILENDQYFMIADDFPYEPDQLAVLNNKTIKYVLVIEL